jgi:hypothetical protein
MKRLTLLVATALTLAGLLFAHRSVSAAASCYLLSNEVGYVCDTDPPPAKFAPPAPIADSILPAMKYGRIADLADVHAEPAMSSPVVRNVGDGYLFSSIQDIANNKDEGRLWYKINYGEWVRQEDMKLASPSQFTGVEIRTQPERPFGWIIVDFPYSTAPGAEPDPNAIKLPRYTPVVVYGAQVDDEGWIWYDIGFGRWMRQTYMSLIDVNPRPEGVGPNDFWVEIDLYEQSIAAYEGDRMVYAGLVSSGLNKWPTYEGLFQVWERHLMTDMIGAEGRVDYYVVEDVPHTMYFDFDIALHGAYWHDRFGYKHSHGCVNMPPRDAEWVYFWSENAPTDLWVWVHTSDPHHLFERSDLNVRFAGP